MMMKAMVMLIRMMKVMIIVLVITMKMIRTGVMAEMVLIMKFHS